MSYLKLRELWNECEKLDESVFNVFVEGLSEIHNKKFVSKQHEKLVGEQPMKPCVAEQRRTVCNRGRWEPQEDDLLHKCVSSHFNPHQGFIAFANDPGNSKRRSKEAAQQRYYALVGEGRW